MLLGYNTNGFVHHRLGDAVAILSDIGYRSIALTLEPDHLDPPTRKGVSAAVDFIGPILSTSDLRVTIETGSRFILDPRRKHQPTLISASAEGRRRRIEFLKAAVDIAAAVSADGVSLWSGAPDQPADDDELYERLTTGLSDILDYANTMNVRLCFEPEPGMFIDTMSKLDRLYVALSHPLLGLTLDVGHVYCLDDGNIRDHVHRWQSVLWNVHIEDARRGTHEHLMFGEGEMDFATVFDALREVAYAGPIHVELSRHSHDAVSVAGRAYDFLQPFLLE